MIVTLAIERKYKLHEGAVPRLVRSLIGDVTIDMLPGNGPGSLKTGTSPANATIIDGEVAPDPAKALEAATKAFDSAGDTLDSIKNAANGIAKLSESAKNLDGFLTSVTDAGKTSRRPPKDLSNLVKANEANFQPALADLREVAGKLNKAFDPETQAALKAGLDRFSSAAARLDSGLAQLDPVLKDLGAPVNHAPSTDIGQAVRRINVLAADLELLTSKLRDGRGGLNTDGTLQKLLTQAELHDNVNNVALSANQTLAQLRAVLADLRVFAEKVARDPGRSSAAARFSHAEIEVLTLDLARIELPLVDPLAATEHLATREFHASSGQTAEGACSRDDENLPGKLDFPHELAHQGMFLVGVTRPPVAGRSAHAQYEHLPVRKVFRRSFGSARLRRGLELEASNSRRARELQFGRGHGNECVACGDRRALALCGAQVGLVAVEPAMHLAE